MGAGQTRLVTDPDAYNRNFSSAHNISAWEGTEPKNADYYNGDRSFVVGKDMYRCYTKGWLWGHIDNEECEPHPSDTTDEEAQKKIKDEIEAIKKRVAELSGECLEL